MFILELFILSLIGGFIGWITNYIAVRLLFRPLKPVQFPFGYKIQGVLPSRKSEIAVSIGSVVEKQLLTHDEILKNLINDKDINILKVLIVENVIRILKDKLPGILHGFTDKTIKKQLDAFMEKDGDRYIREMLENVITNAAQHLSVSRIVKEKIEALDLVSFETMVVEVVKNELRHIEYLGAVLGFFIGILQGIVVLLFK
ncbi:MAG: DUF445 family protein [Clostridiaceae bacterium]|nr:DUF445 family protein [Clostridiaceae bacterium]